MVTWYNWFYYEELEIQEVVEHIKLLEKRKKNIIENKDNRAHSAKEKEAKLKGIQMSIDALKYKYSL